MTERNRILAFTRVAFLDAIVFSFLAIQFVIPPTFVVFLWFVPIIFALKIYYSTFPIAALAGIVVTLMATIIFGVPVGVSTCIYLMAGTVLGLVWRYQLPFALRLLLTSFAFALGLTFAMILFSYLANIGMGDISSAIPEEALSIARWILPLLVCGLVLWSLLLGFGSDRLLAQILHHLEIETEDHGQKLSRN